MGSVPPLVSPGLLTEPSVPISTQSAPEPSVPKDQPEKLDVFSMSFRERPDRPDAVPLFVPMAEPGPDEISSAFQNELVTWPMLLLRPTRPPAGSASEI